MDDLHNRRAFLRAAMAAGVAWAAADIVQVEEALAFAGHQAAGATAADFKALTREQATAVDALASRILPSVDGRPGAHDAGVVYFVDQALGSFNSAQKSLYADGITDLNRRAASTAPGTAFADLAAAQQDTILKDIEQTPFFQAARFDTIVGTFALPRWGGNRDYLGWHLIGFDHQPRFQAPFGFYDADVNRRG